MASDQLTGGQSDPAALVAADGRLIEGATFVSRGRTVTEADIVMFASLTGDFSPQHTDAVFAAGSPFGERVAHGLLVVSYAVGLIPIDASRIVALRRFDQVVFKRPVRIGDTIHLEARIARVRTADADHDTVSWDWNVKRDDGKTAVTAKVDVLWRR